MPVMRVWNGTSWDVISGVPGVQGPQGPAGGNFNVTLSGNTAGVMAQVSSGTLTWAGGANITLSQNGNAISIIGAAGGAGGGAAIQMGGNTTGTTALVSSGTLTLAGGAGITLSQAGGNAITIMQPEVTRSLLFECPAQQAISHGNASLYLQPLQIRGPLTATEFNWMMSNTLTSAGSSAALTCWAGIYDVVNSTSLALLSSASITYSWTSASTSRYNSMRQWSMPFNMDASRGDYACGMLIRTTGGAGAGSFNVFGASTQNFQGVPGAVVAATHRPLPFLGVYSSSTTALPAGIPAASIIGSSTLARRWDIIFRALGA